VRHAPGALVTRYARSIFAVARDADKLDEVRKDLAEITDAWRQYPELALLVMNPRLSREKKRGILTALSDRVGAGTITRNFLDLLLDKDRLEVLYDIGSRFEDLWRIEKGQVEVTVTTAVPLSETLQKSVYDFLAAKCGKEPLITWGHDPRILGGLVLLWPDRIYDGSLARKLENLRLHLAQGAPLAAAQL
jgi:F-type H+-transporting ATPase subunit delta